MGIVLVDKEMHSPAFLCHILQESIDVNSEYTFSGFGISTRAFNTEPLGSVVVQHATAMGCLFSMFPSHGILKVVLERL